MRDCALYRAAAMLVAMELNRTGRPAPTGRSQRRVDDGSGLGGNAAEERDVHRHEQADRTPVV